MFLGFVCWSISWGAARAVRFASEQGTAQKSSARTQAAGSITQPGPVQITGTAACKEPLTEPLSQKPCVYLKRTIVQEMEARPGPMGSGSASHEIRRKPPETQSAPFAIQDSTGRVRVLPEGATVEARTLIERPRKPTEPGVSRETIRIEAVCVGDYITVSAFAQAKGGGMILSRDPAGLAPFLISIQSRAGAEAAAISTTMPLRLLSASMALFGLVLLAVAFR